LVVSAYALYPYLYTVFSGQQYINPRVSLKAHESYELEFWVRLPSIANTRPFQEALEQCIADFTTGRSNIKVNITYLPPAQAGQRLQQALATGTPPDVLFHADSSQAFYGELQVPLSLYLNQQDRTAWPEAVWQQALVNNRVYALPVALFPRVMMVNSSLWQPTNLSLEQVLTSGWNWDQFLAAIAEAKQAQVYGFVPTSIGDALFAAMTTVWGQPAAFDPDGAPLWTEAFLENIAAGWKKLQQSPGVPTPANTMDENCLVLFLQQRAASIGPLNHNLTPWLWQEALKAGIQPAIWPLPNETGHSDFRSVYLAVFRQAEYQGHRHTKAAAEFALWLAPHLAEYMGRFASAIPAQTSLLTSLELPYDPASRQTYTAIDKALSRPYGYGPEPGLAEEHWQHTIAPAWSAYVTGQYTKEQFVQAVLSGLARATMTGP